MDLELRKAEREAAVNPDPRATLRLIHTECRSGEHTFSKWINCSGPTCYYLTKIANNGLTTADPSIIRFLWEITEVCKRLSVSPEDAQIYLRECFFCRTQQRKLSYFVNAGEQNGIPVKSEQELYI